MIMIGRLNTNAVDFDNRLCHTITGTLLADYKKNHYSNIKKHLEVPASFYECIVFIIQFGFVLESGHFRWKGGLPRKNNLLQSGKQWNFHFFYVECEKLNTLSISNN